MAKPPLAGILLEEDEELKMAGANKSFVFVSLYTISISYEERSDKTGVSDVDDKEDDFCK